MYVKKIIKRFVLYFLIPAIPIVAGLLHLNKSVYTGELRFTRDLNPVTIKRDEFGIPTIEAKTFKDASYGLGFAHCQDRLWSIYFRRLLFAGRLSEVFGELTLSLDKLMRSLSLERYARYTLDHLDPDTIEHLQAYVDGFNDARSSMKILPLEFWMSWITIEKIQVVDMVTAVKGISYFLTFGHVSELIYSRLEEVLGPEKVRELIPSEPQNFMWNNVTILNDDELKQMGIFEAFNKSKVLTSPTGQEFPQERRAPRSPSIITLLEGDNEKFVDNNDVKQEASKPAAAAATFEKAGQIGGSNAWVIHGNHTTTGKPIIANDPHLTNAMPSFWYNAAMITEEGYLSGVSIPGCPYIIIGKSKDMAWGFTANMMDTADLYNITVRGEMYYYEGHWFPLQKYEEKIRIRSKGKAVIYPVYETHHGVLIDNYFMEYYGKKAYKIRENERFAFAWMGYTSDDTTVESFKRLPFIKTADEMVANWKGATQLYMNIHFATQTGDIGFILLGRIPIRKTTSHGVKPLDGSKKENDWLGWIPWEDQPRVINPKKGYIVSANNKIATDNVKWHSMYRSFSTARAVRIEEMVSDFVKNNKKISVEDVKKMQLDVLDVCARDAVPIIVKCARKYLNSGYQPSLIQTSQINTMLEEFDRWDYRMEKESIAASLLAVWEIMFKHKTLETLTSIGFDEDTRKTFLNETLYENFIFRKINSWSNTETANFDEYWCRTFENQGKPSPCLYNLVKALEETWVHLEKLAGKEFSGWQWQRIHSDDYTHTPFSNTMLRRFFHRAAPSSGNGRTVKVSTMPKGGLTGQWTPNMRAILSLEGQDHSYAVIDTGISGSPQSQHYDDQMKLHQEGSYIKMQEKKLEQWKEKLEIVFGDGKKEETVNTGNSERKEGEL